MCSQLSSVAWAGDPVFKSRYSRTPNTLVKIECFWIFLDKELPADSLGVPYVTQGADPGCDGTNVGRFRYRVL